MKSRGTKEEIDSFSTCLELLLYSFFFLFFAFPPRVILPEDNRLVVTGIDEEKSSPSAMSEPSSPPTSTLYGFITRQKEWAYP